MLGQPSKGHPYRILISTTLLAPHIKKWRPILPCSYFWTLAQCSLGVHEAIKVIKFCNFFSQQAMPLGTSLESLTYLVLKISQRTALSNYVLIMPMRICTITSTSWFSKLNKLNMQRKKLSGLQSLILTTNLFCIFSQR